MIPITYYPTPDVQRALEIQQTTSYRLPSRPAEKTQDFRNILNRVDAVSKPQTQNGERQPDDAQQARQRRDHTKRIAELRSTIALLQRKQSMCAHQGKMTAELTQAQNELYWLMLRA